MKRLALILSLFVLTLVSAAAQVTGTVGLTWQPNTEADLAGYRLYRGLASGNYDWKKDVGLATATTAEGLQHSTTYFFVVTAINTANMESLPSNEVTYVTPTPDPVTPVTGIQAQRTSTQIEVTWDLPPESQYVRRWRVKWGRAGQTDFAETTVTTPLFNFTTLGANLVYGITVIPEGWAENGKETTLTVSGFPANPRLLIVKPDTLTLVYPNDLTP